MFRYYIALYLLITVTSSYLEVYRHNFTYPKCCDHHENLKELDGNYTCARQNNRTHFISTNRIYQRNENSSSDDTCCMDYVNKSDTIKLIGCSGGTVLSEEIRHMPKCCPPHYKYDTDEYKCVHDTSSVHDDEFDEGVYFVLAGLPQCVGVIVDKTFNTTEDILSYLTANNTQEDYCVDRKYLSSDFVLRECKRDLKLCKRYAFEEDKMKCLRKCCRDGQHYVKGKCVSLYERGLSVKDDISISDKNERYGVIHGARCRTMYIAPVWRKNQSVSYLTYNYTIDAMGTVIYNKSTGEQSLFPSHMTGYCLEYIERTKKYEAGYYLFLCTDTRDDERAVFIIKKVFCILSCVFLTITLAGYSILAEMRNLHGKTLMCHCVSLLMAFSSLLVVLFHSNVKNKATCTGLGYLIMYTWLAAFTWLNVLCFDMWWTFGSFRIHTIHQKKRERKKFLLYNLYGWTCPLVITLVSFVIQTCKPFAERFLPQVGFHKCFFEKDANQFAFMIYFLLPMSLMILFNLVLFIRTILYCNKVKGEINKMKDSSTHKSERNKIFSADKEKLAMVMKLFVVMGISWFFEIISASLLYRYTEDNKALQVLELCIDIYNNAQGIFIFVIFMFKEKVMRSVKSYFGLSARSLGALPSGQTTTTILNTSSHRPSTISSTVTLSKNMALSTL